MPCSRIELVSSSSSWASKYWRGCPGCGEIFSIGQWNALRSWAPGAGAAEGKRASRPRPRARRAALGSGCVMCADAHLAGARLLLVVAGGVEDLARQAQVALRALGLRVVEQRGLAVRGRLGELHVARDDGVEDVEVRLHLVGDLVGERVAAVEHRQHHALDAELGVEGVLDAIDRRHEVGQPLEREVLALERHQHPRRRGERVERQQAERGRAVEDHVGVALDVGAERVAEARAAIGGVDELELGGDEVLRRGDDVEQRDRRATDDVRHRGLPDEHVVDRALHRLPAHADAARGVALRVAVDEQRPLLCRGEARGEVDGCRRLANPAFLVGDGENHGRSGHSATRRGRGPHADRLITRGPPPRRGRPSARVSRGRARRDFLCWPPELI